MPAVETCPPALRCVQDFIALIDGTPVVGNPEPRKVLRAWLVTLAADPESLAVLNSARDRGANLYALLLGAVMLRFSPAWFDQSLIGLRFGPISLGQCRMQDIDTVLAGAESAEDALMGTTAGAAELRMIKALLDEMEAAARAEGGEPREAYVRGRDGKRRKRKIVIKGGFVAVTTVQANAALVQGPLHRSGRGAHGDAALSVFLLLVYGHLRAVASETSTKLAVDVVATGFRLPEQTLGGPSNPVEALRARVGRSLKQTAHVKRARHLAGVLGIPFSAS
jgi:hypothetical protein